VATQHEADEADIRRRINGLAEAIRAMDLEAVMPVYAPDIVSFDVQAPLRTVGAAAKRKNWVEAFTTFRPPLSYEIRDLTVTVGGDVAFAYSLNRLSGTLQNGTGTSGFWVRATACFRKIDGNWLIVHDQASVPLDLETRSPALNLEP
jgi:ketosteroid isomerase-like protein